MESTKMKPLYFVVSFYYYDKHYKDSFVIMTLKQIIGHIDKVKIQKSARKS